MKKYNSFIIILLYVLNIVGCKSSGLIGDNKETAKMLNQSQKNEYQYALTEATKQKIFGNYKEAITLYEKCLQVNNLSDVAHYQLGGIKMIMGEYEDAKMHTKKAIEIDKKNFWYMMQLAQLYNIVNERDSLRKVYERIVDYWPERIDINFDMARIFTEEGEYDKALKILDRIEKENGISEPVSLMKQQIFVKTGKSNMAIDEINKLIEFVPGEIRYLGILAELYSSTGKNFEATEIYEEIFSIDPNNTFALLSYSEFMRNLGKKDEQFATLEKVFRSDEITLDQKLRILIDYLTDNAVFMNQKNEIKGLIDILLKDFPENYKVRTAYADYLVKIDKYQEALEEYEYVLNIEKGNYLMWEQTLYIENMLGNNENIYRKSGEALKYFPEMPVLYLFRGNSAMRLEKNEEAIEILQNGLNKVENNNELRIQYYVLLAEAYRTVGNDNKSDEYFELVLDLDQNNLSMLNNYSYYLSLREEKLDIAEKMSRKTIIADPENSTYLDTYAWIMFKKEHYKKAKEYIEKAVKFGGMENPEILEHYGDILERIGLKNDALKYWKLSIDKGNKEQEIVEKIKKLERNE